MPQWLSDAAHVEAPVAAGTLALRLVISVLFGVAIAATYRASHGRESRETRTLTTTLVLLTVLLAMVSMVIGDSVARAFGLVGALSIVRFRTIVEDTRDTAFVIFAVIVGMAIGTGMLLVPLIGVPIVALTAISLQRNRRQPVTERGGRYAMTIRLGLGRDPAALAPTLERHTAEHELQSVATARQGAAIDFVYRIALQPSLQPGGGLTALVTELNHLEGVQSVEIQPA